VGICAWNYESVGAWLPVLLHQCQHSLKQGNTFTHGLQLYQGGHEAG